MKRFLFALSLLMPTIAQAQFSFNRISCVVDLINACVQVEARFTPEAAGTNVSMRIKVDHRAVGANDLSSFGINIMSFFDGTSDNGPATNAMPWLSSYGTVGLPPGYAQSVQTTNLQDVSIIVFQRYLGGCDAFFDQPSFRTCQAEDGFGALQLDYFTSIVYSSSILNQVRLSANAQNAAGQWIGIGCRMDMLGLANGGGSYVTPPQSGSNSCITTESNQSLAVGPRAVITTPEPSTYALMAFGLVVVGVVQRKRAAV